MVAQVQCTKTHWVYILVGELYVCELYLKTSVLKKVSEEPVSDVL